MANKKALEALDRTLQDLRGQEATMGGALLATSWETFVKLFLLFQEELQQMNLMRVSNPGLMTLAVSYIYESVLIQYTIPPGERRKRLLGVREQMLSQPPKTRIHFEMASYTEMLLLEQLVDLVIPHSDSLGMNEQELANLVSLYQFGNVSFVSDSNPRVATVLDQMRHLLRLIETSSKEKPGSRKLTRIHVHTLAYQAILTVDTTLWPHSDIAAAKASLTAYRHVCASPQVDPDKAKLIMDDSFSVSLGSSGRVVIEPQRPVSCWREGSLHLCVAPVLVCKVSVQTAGGGDNISAAALAMQL
ncbi:ADP-dependent glucokinase-like [Homalodisca vitripennis]|uniref:ADP-dependent glucokinase-like n=1 Tax=Homalodisca vitripennis TaxID=197043 RepID=UPI001EEA1879|nr:ADP-dependent glucokinase-like [Homalodisca vitripennis]